MKQTTPPPPTPSLQMRSLLQLTEWQHCLALYIYIPWSLHRTRRNRFLIYIILLRFVFIRFICWVFIYCICYRNVIFPYYLASLTVLDYNQSQLKNSTRREEKGRGKALLLLELLLFFLPFDQKKVLLQIVTIHVTYYILLNNVSIVYILIKLLISIFETCLESMKDYPVFFCVLPSSNPMNLLYSCCRLSSAQAIEPTTF